MYEYKIEGMTCGGCVKSITKAIKSRDDKAEVNIDLRGQIVKVKSERSIDEIGNLICEIGFPILKKESLSL